MSSLQPARLITLGLLAALLAGCGGGGGDNGGFSGGGGGGGGSSSGALIGKIVGTDGGPIPGAVITVDEGEKVSALSQGGFQATGLSTGIHRVFAQMTVGGVAYTGSTQVLINANATTSNAIIEVSPANQQINVTGVVTDSFGFALRNARVYLAVPVSSPTSSGDVQSLVAFTNINGNYQIQNVPTTNPNYTIAASLLGYQNVLTNLGNFPAGQTRVQNFTLTAASNQSTLTPQNLTAQAFTQPSDVLSPQARTGALAHATASTGVYDQIRRALSPAYARAAASLHPASLIKSLSAQSRSGFGSYAISIDLLFDESARNSLSGFRVYRGDGTSALAAYDFLQDPLANSFTDLDPSYFADQQYRFAVSAVNTNSTETALSTTATVTPLSQMLLTQPVQNQTATNPVTVSWQGVNGADNYGVFVYSEYPTVGSTLVTSNQTLPSTARSYTLTKTLTTGDYWIVAAASADSGAEISVSQITMIHVR